MCPQSRSQPELKGFGPSGLVAQVTGRELSNEQTALVHHAREHRTLFGFAHSTAPHKQPNSTNDIC